MKKLINYFLAAVLLLSASCEDDNIFKQLVDPPVKVLPPATQIGANTFGCKVNGKVWLPNETAWVEFVNGGLDIVARNRQKGFLGIGLHIGRFVISSKGTFSIASSTPYFSQASYIENNNAFTTDDINTGSITITRLDTNQLHYIVSGTFSFKARHESSGEIIEITEGRFDLRKY